MNRCPKMPNRSRAGSVLGLALLPLALAGCLGDSSGDEGTAGLRTHLLGLGVGDGTLFGTTRLDAGDEDGSDFWEHDAQSIAFAHGRWIFVVEPYVGRIVRYVLDEENRPTSPVALAFDGGSVPSHITFVDDSKAYVSLEGSGKLAILNPASMTLSGSVDLTPWAVGDASPEPSAAAVRDGLLFVALSQRITTYSAHDSAWVAVVDIDRDSVIKVLVDPRVTCLGSPDDGNRTVIRTTNGDLYFYSNALWGYQSGAKDGFLRIPAGDTAFDPSYRFSLAETSVGSVSGGVVGYGLTFAHAGNGIAYTMLQVPGLTSNPPDYVNDRNYQPMRIDLAQSTIEVLPLPASSGWASAGISVEDSGSVLFALSPADSAAGLYRYHPASGAADPSPVLRTTGAPWALLALED